MSELPKTQLPVLPTRRLIPEETAEAMGLKEYFSTVLDSRVIEIPPKSEAFQTHQELASGNLALLQARIAESGSLQLIIPDGAQTVRQVLKPLAEDVERYSPIFNQIGQQLGRLAGVGYGVRPVTTTRSILSSIAFAPQGRTSFENSIFFIPPYAFEKGVTPEDSSRNIRTELINSEYFTEYKIRTLLYETLLGFAKE